MKIGVLSDTHIPDRAADIPEEILESFKSVDMVIHAGDLVELGVLERLKNVCKEVKAVWGNMDPDNVRSKLPEKELLRIGKYKIGITHGSGHPDYLVDCVNGIFKKEKVDLVIFGHSHSGLNRKIGNVLYFNPGTATDKIFSAYNSYGIIEINDKIEAEIIKI